MQPYYKPESLLMHAYCYPKYLRLKKFNYKHSCISQILLSQVAFEDVILIKSFFLLRSRRLSSKLFFFNLVCSQFAFNQVQLAAGWSSKALDLKLKQNPWAMGDIECTLQLIKKDLFLSALVILYNPLNLQSNTQLPSVLGRTCPICIRQS